LGENWHFVTHGLGHLIVSLIAVAESNSNVLYAGTDDGIFYSQNAGESWIAVDNAGGQIHFGRPESHRSIVVSKTNPEHVIAGSYTGDVFYSENSGRSWKRLGNGRPFEKPSPITALAWFEKEKILYASSDQGMAKFDFENSEWKYFLSGPKSVTDFWAAPDSPQTVFAAGQNKIFISHDGCQTWKHGALIPRGVIFRLLVPENEKNMWAAWNDGWKGGVIYSNDGGENWKPWDKEMNADLASDPTRSWAGVHGRINALKADPFDKNVFFRTDWWGVWRSDDQGVTWNEKIKGAPNTVATDIAFSPEGRVYVSSMDNGLLGSDDDGKTYQTFFPAKEYIDDVNGDVWRVLTLGKKFLATSTPWGTDYDQVILSQDSGASFQKLRNGLPLHRPKINVLWQRGYARAIAVRPDKPEVIYLGIDGDDGGGFFVSKDGGQSWQRPENQPSSLKIYNGLAVDPENPARILWGASGKKAGVYLSEDGGNHWRLAESQIPMKDVYDIAFGPGRHVYAAGGSHDEMPVLYGSEDHGEHWKVLKKFEGNGGAKGLCVLPDGRVAVGIIRWHGKAPGHVYLGSSDGSVWENIDGDLPEGDGPAALRYNEKEKMLYLARFAGSVYKTKIL